MLRGNDQRYLDMKETSRQLSTFTIFSLSAVASKLSLQKIILGEGDFRENPYYIKLVLRACAPSDWRIEPSRRFQVRSYVCEFRSE